MLTVGFAVFFFFFDSSFVYNSSIKLLHSATVNMGQPQDLRSVHGHSHVLHEGKPQTDLLQRSELWCSTTGNPIGTETRSFKKSGFGLNFCWRNPIKLDSDGGLLMCWWSTIGWKQVL